MVCGNCFKEIENASVCPFCGYDMIAEAKTYPQALKIGSILNGQYVIGRVLGQGGFGITYLALDYFKHMPVAIKEFFPERLVYRANNTFIIPSTKENESLFLDGKDRFLEESKTLATFRDNENVVHIFQFFNENGTAYLVMEYLEGVGLDQYMSSKNGVLTVDEANIILTPVMHALAQIHAKGIVHRDIAPDNIMVIPDGTPKLIDFGAARYSTGEKTKTLDVVLKDGFAPVEQYTEKTRQGPYTDVYAFCATYYYAITGKIIPQAVGRLVEDTLIEPKDLCEDVWDELNTVLLKGLAVKAQERYQTMGEMMCALTTAMRSRPVKSIDSTNPKSPKQGFSSVSKALKIKSLFSSSKASDFIRNHHYIVIAVAVLFIIILVGTSVTGWDSIKGITDLQSNQSMEVIQKAKRIPSENYVAKYTADGYNDIQGMEFTPDEFETIGYLYQTDELGDKYHYIGVITNNSQAAVKVHGYAVAKDGNGKKVSTDSDTIDILYPGETSVCEFDFDDAEIKNVETEYSYEHNNEDLPVSGVFDVQKTLSTDGELIVAATNLSDYIGYFVKAVVVCFDSSDNVTAINYCYFMDANHCIGPGVTMADKCHIYDAECSRIEVFLRGKGLKVLEDEQVLDSNCFEVDVYHYEDTSYLESADWIFAIKNNSDKKVKINVDSVLFDAQNNVVDAAHGYLNNLVPGDTGIYDLWHQNYAVYADHIEYSISFKEETYESNLHDGCFGISVSPDMTLGNANTSVQFTVQNDLDENVLVDLIAIFMDDIGNVVDLADCRLAIDSKSETETTIFSQNAFSRVAVYPTAYYPNK